MTTTTPAPPASVTTHGQPTMPLEGADDHTTCPFCPYWLNVSDSAFDTVIAEGPGLRVLPALGMLVEGYLLATTHEHVLSFAAMPPSWTRAAQTWLDTVLARLSSTFGEYVVFEHGSCDTGSAGACVDHAHMHLVPLGRDFYQKLLDALPWVRLSNSDELARYRDRPYAYVSFHDDRFILPEPKFGSQWLRRQVASFIGTDAWDWALTAGSAELVRTLAALGHAAAGPSSDRTSNLTLVPGCRA